MANNSAKWSTALRLGQDLRRGFLSKYTLNHPYRGEFIEAILS
jgi:hypothetical protein